MFLVKVLIMVMVAYGGLNSAGYIWAIGDIGVGLMAWLNIVGILVIFMVARPTLTMLRDYEAQLKAGVKEYSFDPAKFGIKNAPYWEERHLKQQQNLAADPLRKEHK